MEEKQSEDQAKVQELPDAWWYRVYIAVIISTAAVILALWAFSLYFSS